MSNNQTDPMHALNQLASNHSANAQNTTDNPEDALKTIMRGDINNIVNQDDRKVKMVEIGNRIPNIVLRKTVEKLRAKGLSETEIIDKILFFDELAEKGQLLDYLEKQKKSNS